MLPNILATSVDYIRSLEEHQALDLVIKLCKALEVEQIDYCHWKSNEALSRSASGDNDLDLLISRADAESFTAILFRLDFRQAQENGARGLPGVLNYYGYDADADRVIHVHLHYQLVLGNDLSKNYRIPIERAYLDSATQVGLFRVPAPEFELMIFVLRMVLKHSTWDSILMGHGALSPSERREFEYLATDENLGKAKKVLEQYLPSVDQLLFDACVQAIQTRCSLKKRIQAGEKTQRALEACARSPQTVDIISKFWRRLSLSVQSRLFRRKSKRRLANGGLLIAIVGGDGSGKSTAIDGVDHWLSRIFDVTKLHMGKPTWSWVTIVIRGLLKIGTMLGLYSFEEKESGDLKGFPGYPSLIRIVCTARDRYLTYLKARRLSSNGGLVVCDRFSLPGFIPIDGPRCEQLTKAIKPNRFIKWLVKMETFYYQQIMLPDLLIVLKVNPEIAVQRKVDENETFVRARSTMVWEWDWSRIPVHIVDASHSKQAVLSEVKSLIWKYL